MPQGAEGPFCILDFPFFLVIGTRVCGVADIAGSRIWELVACVHISLDRLTVVVA